MKLVTQQGELELSEDFALTMERTNPLLSDQGDASIPASLPGTPHNLAIVGHKDRIDRANIYTNKMEAILTVGPVQKRGQLVIDTISRSSGIDASFAIDSSDLYVKAKDKSLKEIFNDIYEQRNSTSVWASHLFGIYSTGNMSYDYSVFPVAVDAYKTQSNSRVSVNYQLNNEPNADQTALVYGARTVKDADGNDVSVPAGYGLAPFLRLNVVINKIFQTLGYTVAANCFDSAPMNKLVLVHHCADCLCNPDHKLYYRDLVPSCTLSEFLTWLLAKFHAQPVIDSQSGQVTIECMEYYMDNGFDVDLTGKIEGDLAVTLQPKKRVVLTPSITIASEDDEDEDGSLAALTRPAAKTMKDFVEKYGEYVEVDEDAWAAIGTGSEAVWGCVVLRKAEGVFYDLAVNPQTGSQQVRRLGTNHFAYDRANSDEVENYDQKDIIPAMLVGRGLIYGAKKDVVPYIGDRIHFHTAIEGQKEKPSQDIMVVQRVFAANFAAKTTGTTQGLVPYNQVSGGVTGSLYTLTNDAMYASFWQMYNEQILLSQAPRLSGRVLTSTARLLMANMAKPKLCKGQLLLPVKLSGNIGDRPVMADAEFVLLKQFNDGPTDPTYPPAQSNGLRWNITDDSADIVDKMFDVHFWDIWEECLEGHGGQGEYNTWDPIEESVVLQNSSVSYGTNNVNVGSPSYVGEVRVLTVPVTLTLDCTVHATTVQYDTPVHYNYSYTIDTTVTYTLTAVAVP